jgi:hypothetical protein
MLVCGSFMGALLSNVAGLRRPMSASFRPSSALVRTRDCSHSPSDSVDSSERYVLLSLQSPTLS